MRRNVKAEKRRNVGAIKKQRRNALFSPCDIRHTHTSYFFIEPLGRVDPVELFEFGIQIR
jgi:hypothetical protein